ncbi:nucleotidyltransferase family protein [Aliarcobacter butzleri]|uniref:nucleotidyltransferase family protein n=1 Tax=Aliarcobacter butzleri TaxID=28197 RepID=UPI003209208B
MERLNNLAILILAAGSSSRLGEPKQLIKHKRETLIKNAVKKALKIAGNVFVVLGHEKEKCEKELEEFKTLNILYNKDYKKGIGTSISLGISYTKYFENTIILLADQPLIPIKHLNSLKNKIDNKSIIASIYEDNINPTVPAIFPKKYYEKLLKLNEDKGAKEILKKEKCIKVQLNKKFTIDIDTIEDVKNFLS